MNAQQSLISAFTAELDNEKQEFRHLLPPSMDVEHFLRVSITAVENNPDLLRADRNSLFVAILKAAEDNLLPDGREGALVPFRTKALIEGKEIWIYKVQWMPMVEGIRKRIWEAAGLILHARVVYDRDEWDYQEGTTLNPITHRPRPGPRGIDHIVAVYSIAKDLNGRIVDWDWMWKEEVEQIRKKARSDKIWADPVNYPEMALKTVVHHHSKSLPLSGNLRRIVERDVNLYAGDDYQERAIGNERSQELPAIPFDKSTPMGGQFIPTPPARSVEGAMQAMAGGGAPTPPAARKRTPKPATVAPAPSRALHEPPVEPAPVAAAVATTNGTIHDAETGEVIEESNSAPARNEEKPHIQPQLLDPNETASPDLPAFLDRRPTTQDALAELTSSPQPNSREEYLSWLETKWDYADTEPKREAIRQYWQLTAGNRAKFGVTQGDIAALAAKMRRQQPA